MKRLSKKQILMLHTQLIQQTGGSDGVRDYNLLDSALETPFQSFGGEDLHPTLQAKAERLGYGLIKNHCMILSPANTDKYPSSSPRDPSPRVSSLLFLQSPDLHTVSYVLQSKSPQTPPSPRPRFLSGFGLQSQARIPLSGLPVRSG